MKTKAILGISAFYHDSAATIIVEGEIAAAAQEERFTRKKHTAEFPVNAVKYCLEYSGFSLDDLDAVVFYDKPLLKFERLLETYYAFAPKGVRQFVTSIPVWLKEKLFFKKLLYEGLSQVENFDKKKLILLFPDHHLSHAASAFFPSPFQEAAVLTIDGVGEWATAAISHGMGNKIILKKEMRFPHSVGLLYSAFTYYLGFRVNSGEYKLMGLAPYGDPAADQTRTFIQLIKKHLVSIREDGSIWLDQSYFQYATGLKMVKTKKWRTLFGFPALRPGEKLEQKHCNLAYAIQKVTEEIVIKMAKHARAITGSEYLCMAGGVALNCAANGKLIKEQVFKDVWIQPAAGDAGGALGAALAAHYMYFENDRESDPSGETMQGAYLGPYYSRKDAVTAFREYGAVYTKIDSFSELCSKTADLLDQGKVIGWFQGRMEFGPRALGNRSILGDPRDSDMQKKLNLKIKYREGFRPFAPSVLIKDAGEYFEFTGNSPYMSLITDVKKKRRKELPDNYAELDLMERLNINRSDVPAVTHLDFSARIQTVHKETNPEFHQLIQAFKEKTGYGLLVNTSFNVRGEPIVCTPEDAYKCFMGTEMDYLVIDNFILTKTEQPLWDNRQKWTVEFEKD